MGDRADEQTQPGGLESTLAGGGPAQPPGALSLQPGDHLDHFVIKGQLGAGAMGVVLAAHDPDLDRRVAIKLVLPKTGAPSSEAAQIRMLREAQSMAKVVHPNVVTVHQVGFAKGQLYIAMEFIDGRTLRGWAQEKPRSLSEVLDVFRAAGEGLRAAHSVGLVHRDFKPDNVLVGHDGRVVVTDFGLVSIAGAASEIPETGGLGSTGRQVVASGDIGQTLTATGSAMGTPAYMAAEQHRGKTLDGRADQFAFCVALWEALYGKRPFHRDTLVAMVHATLDGVPDPPPDPPAIRGSVPRSIRRALERGLRPNPASRWADMGVLLGKLRHDRNAVKRIVAIAGAGTLAAAAVGSAGYYWATHRAGPACDAGADKAAEIWSAAKLKVITASLTETGAASAEASSTHVGERLDRWAENWAAAYSEACEATHVRGEQSPERLDRRMSCLERNRQDVGILVTTLTTTTDATIVGQAPGAAASLSSVGHCAGEHLELWDDTTIPPELRAEAKAIRHELDAAVILFRLGQAAAALKDLEALIPRAEAVGSSLLLAEVLTSVGTYMPYGGKPTEAEPILRRAAKEAADAGVPDVEAEAWLQLANVVGQSLGDPKRGLGILAGMESAVNRTENPRLRAAYERTTGSLLYYSQQFEEAETRLRKSIEMTGPEDSRSLFMAYNALAAMLGDQGRADDAMQAYESALEHAHAHYGVAHPNIAAVYNNQGMQFRVMGDLDKMRERHQAALEILRSSLGEEHPWVAISYEGLGVAAQLSGDFEEARKQHQMALAIRQAALGSNDPSVASSLNNVAGVQLELGEVDDAIEKWTRAREIWVAVVGSDRHTQVAIIDQNLGTAHFRQGKNEQAKRYLLSAMAITEALYGEEHPDLANVLGGLAAAAVVLEDCDGAKAYAARGHKIAAAYPQVGPLVEAAFYSAEGWCGVREKEYETALRAFGQASNAREGGPNDPYAEATDLNGKAKALNGLRRLDEARAIAEEGRSKAKAAGKRGEPILAELDAFLEAL